MVTIRLYGVLAERFGVEFKAEVKSVAEAVKCLLANVPGLRAQLELNHEYAVYVNDRNVGETQLLDPTGEAEVRIVPVITGAKAGVLQTVGGIILIAVGLYTGQAWLVNIGVSLTISGVMTLLMSPPPEISIAEVERSDNFLLSNGGRNDTINGNPIPVGYGRLRLRPRPVSGGTTTKDY